MIRTFIKRLFRKGTPMLEVGDKAPDFEVQDHTGTVVRSGGLVGKRYVLWFYPKADTPG